MREVGQVAALQGLPSKAWLKATSSPFTALRTTTCGAAEVSVSLSAILGEETGCAGATAWPANALRRG